MEADTLQQLKNIANREKIWMNTDGILMSSTDKHKQWERNVGLLTSQKLLCPFVIWAMLRMAMTLNHFRVNILYSCHFKGQQTNCHHLSDSTCHRKGHRLYQCCRFTLVGHNKWPDVTNADVDLMPVLSETSWIRTYWALSRSVSKMHAIVSMTFLVFSLYLYFMGYYNCVWII